MVGSTVQATDQPTVNNNVGFGKTVNINGSLLVQDHVYQHAFADGYGVGAGIVGVGIINPVATVGGTITTGFDGTVQNAGSVTVSGNDNASTLANARGQAYGIGAGTNVSTTATTSPNVNTSVTGSITSSGNVAVESVVQTNTQALSSGTAVAGVAVGVLTATATDSPTVGTSVTGSITSTGGGVRISALRNYDPIGQRFLSDHLATASSESLTVSLLVSASSANVTADAKGTVAASTASGSTLAAPGGTITVEARSSDLSLARAKTAAGAFVNVSHDINPTATSEGSTSAKLLGNVRQGSGASSTTGANSLAVVAQGSNLATGVLDTSSGGAINVNANTSAQAIVPNTAKVNAQLGSSGSTIIATNDATVRAAGISRRRRHHALGLGRGDQRRRLRRDRLDQPADRRGRRRRGEHHGRARSRSTPRTTPARPCSATGPSAPRGPSTRPTARRAIASPSRPTTA